MLTWAILLLLAGMLILVAEFFVPSSGLLGLMSSMAIIGGIVLGFYHSVTAGTSLLLAALVAVPALILTAVKYWPQTPLGRQMLVPLPEHQDEVLPETDAYRRLPDLVGRRGTARSLMLPGGTVDIDGRKYDATTEGMAVEAGQAVYVVRVETQRLVVRPDDRVIAAELSGPVAPPRAFDAEEPSPEYAVPKSKERPFEEPLI